MNKTTLTICLLIITSLRITAQDTSSLAIARRVADKVIADTRFEFKQVIRKEQLGMQVVDFRPMSLQPKEAAFARRIMKAMADSIVTFGVTSGGRVKIWVNEEMVFEQGARQVTFPREMAYGRFVFNNQFSAKVKKGYNKVLIKYERPYSAPVLFLRAVTGSLDQDSSVNFNTDANNNMGWQMEGPYSNFQDVATTEKMNKRSFSQVTSYWKTFPEPSLSELVIAEDATYRRDSYADWNYPNGATLWSMMAIDDAGGGSTYRSFIKKYSDFIINNNTYFKWQYDSLFAYRGSFHRIYRQSMLDDSGTPALPLLELYLKEPGKGLKEILDPVSMYVSKQQIRLPDSTFCRPEPVNYTVWADDLFMSVPFLLRLARATGDQQYYADAAKQVINFRKYLYDANTGLYKHGWFSTSGQSVAFWGRANGWVIWATAELLTWLPPKDPQYKTILGMFKKHMAAVAACQDEDGMWHQLLNRKDSYKETSCTALFTLAMARGVRNGWLDKSYKKKAVMGWQAVLKHIDADGTVHGICRGTEIGATEEYYMSRPVIDHDPRGLGAVITAAVEMAKLK